MDDIRERIAQDLRTTAARLRQSGGTAAVEPLPRTIGDGCLADEVDAIQVNESREIGFAMRELLMARVSRLSAALDRMNDGKYGVCVECGQAISTTRLHALPEAQTCLHCQDRIERRGRPLHGRRRGASAASDDRLMVAERQASVRASYFPNEEDRTAYR
jgi:DnaK suppressor protein